MNISGVGRVTISGQVAIKEVEQYVSGSAYMKIPGQCIALHHAGYNHIRLLVNRDHPYLNKIYSQVDFLNKVIPRMEIQLYDGRGPANNPHPKSPVRARR